MATECALDWTASTPIYGDSHVLHGACRSGCGEGRLLGLLGRNGAGKTTCMAYRLGLLRPRRGTIELFGEHGRWAGAREIAAQGIASCRRAAAVQEPVRCART